MATVRVGSARIDERGKAYGGRAGDQTGRELSTQKYYVHKKGWRVFRAKSRDAALKIAADMEAACKNSHIGYDQWQRNTLYKAAEPMGFDCGKVRTDCETDCSALVRVCCAYAGIMGLPGDFRTGNMPKNLLATGMFVELRGAKYTDQSAYLGKGDILVTKTHGHTVVVLDDGVKYEGAVEAKDYALGERLLKHGAEGADVKQLQQYLIQLDYDLGRWGADGEFGDATELAVKAFQKDKGLDADGQYGKKTHAALIAAAKENRQEGATLGNRLLKRGSEGADVKQLQQYLIQLGYDMGKWGADGEFGGATELAVRAFQKDSALEADGRYGEKTHEALLQALEHEKDEGSAAVAVDGGSCYVRSLPGTDGKILGVVHRGEVLPYAGETAENGWLKVVYQGGDAWISGKYGRRMENVGKDG